MSRGERDRRRRVPARALLLSLAALAVPVAGAFASPETIGEYAAMLWLLPLLPAFLLAYYRGWRGVSLAFGAAMAALALTQVAASLLGRTLQHTTLLLLVLAAFVGISLGLGWLVEVLGDITALRRREEALRRLEKALETMQIGVTITDPSGRIIYVNPADARQHGYTVDELTGRDVAAYAPEPTRRILTMEELKNLRSWKREGVNARKDGTTFPVQLRSDVVLGLDGEPLGIVTVCEDITERRAAEERLFQAYGRLRESHAALQTAQLQLIEADKMESVGRLAAGVAHEVKNPLMTLLTGVRYLSDFLPPADQDVAQLLSDMRDAVLRADAVVRGLLDFSAPRALDLTPQDLNAIVERCLPLVKHQVDRAQVVLRCDLGTDLPPLNLDGFKIQQVLINLIGNAIHATPSGGQVTVRTSVRPVPLVSGAAPAPPGDPFASGESAVVLEVEDTGRGIPDDQLAKVFDPFFTTKPTGQGTGLGLSVTRQIVEMHGGRIRLENRPEGGVRATVVLTCDVRGGNDGKETHPGG